MRRISLVQRSFVEGTRRPLVSLRFRTGCDVCCAVLELVPDLFDTYDSSVDKDISASPSVRNSDIDLGPFEVTLATSEAQTPAGKVLTDDDFLGKSRLTNAS